MYNGQQFVPGQQPPQPQGFPQQQQVMYQGMNPQQGYQNQPQPAQNAYVPVSPQVAPQLPQQQGAPAFSQFQGFNQPQQQQQYNAQTYAQPSKELKLAVSNAEQTLKQIEKITNISRAQFLAQPQTVTTLNKAQELLELKINQAHFEKIDSVLYLLIHKFQLLETENQPTSLLDQFLREQELLKNAFVEEPVPTAQMSQNQVPVVNNQPVQGLNLGAQGVGQGVQGMNVPGLNLGSPQGQPMNGQQINLSGSMGVSSPISSSQSGFGNVPPQPGMPMNQAQINPMNNAFGANMSPQSNNMNPQANYNMPPQQPMNAPYSNIGAGVGAQINLAQGISTQGVSANPMNGAQVQYGGMPVNNPPILPNQQPMNAIPSPVQKYAVQVGTSACPESLNDVGSYLTNNLKGINLEVQNGDIILYCDNTRLPEVRHYINDITTKLSQIQVIEHKIQ
ncbi:Hypothetical_protein [Hexamita inflata]|uniref:Hypothetical_protein n=1 Tax=Hexamita inflata TaxID=28002 RepID=A0AA86NDS2_9EUKA|nr:Hypothetical protein HINF_LOCUS4896 [Hexamita inflata]